MIAAVFLKSAWHILIESIRELKEAKKDADFVN